MKQIKENKGFTLVELIIVIAIIGIIAVAIVPQYLNYIEKSKRATDENTIAETIHAAQVAFVGIDKDELNNRDNTVRIDIDANGVMTYPLREDLDDAVAEIIVASSYEYKSELYRDKYMIITINDDGTYSISGTIEDALKDSLSALANSILSGDWDKVLGNLGQVGEDFGNIFDEWFGSDDSTDASTEDSNSEEGTTEDTGCVATGSEVTLANGSVKKVEDLNTEDKLLAFDHETGEFVEADILAIAYHGDRYRFIMNLEFSNEEKVRLIDYHGLFDITLNKYVYMTNDNFTEYVGHEFAIQSEAGHETAVLENAYLTCEYVGAYAVVTDYHMNCYTNGFLSIIPEAKIAVDAFEFDSDLKYDVEKMQQDIETYGLYVYEDFAEYISEEVFNLMPFKYVKVTEGKGLTSMEEVVTILEGMSGYLNLFNEEATYIEDCK